LDAGSESSIAGVSTMGMAGSTAATCTGTADVVQAAQAATSCNGTADVVQAAQAATCTGTATDGVTVCDLDAGTDNTAECATGCASTEAVAELAGPMCDLDSSTDNTADCAAGCDSDAVAEIAGPVCDLDSTTNDSAECAAGCTAGTSPGEYVSKFEAKYSTDGTQWLDVLTCSAGICSAIQFDGNSDSDTPVSVVFPQPVTARYLRIVPTSDGIVGSATIRGAIQTCGGRTDGLCAFDVQTYAGTASTKEDVLDDVAVASWQSLALQTEPTTEFIGTTQAAQEARFVRLTSDCDGVVSVADFRIHAQACSCDSETVVWPTDGAAGCAAPDTGR